VRPLPLPIRIRSRSRSRRTQHLRTTLLRVVAPFHPIRSGPGPTPPPAWCLSIRAPSSRSSLARSCSARTPLTFKGAARPTRTSAATGPGGVPDKIGCWSSAVLPLDCCCDAESSCQAGGVSASELSAAVRFAGLYCMSARRGISFFLFSAFITPVSLPSGGSIPPLVAGQ
jgi:hypothetical protein